MTCHQGVQLKRGREPPWVMPTPRPVSLTLVSGKQRPDAGAVFCHPRTSKILPPNCSAVSSSSSRAVASFRGHLIGGRGGRLVTHRQWISAQIALALGLDPCAPCGWITRLLIAEMSADRGLSRLSKSAHRDAWLSVQMRIS